MPSLTPPDAPTALTESNAAEAALVAAANTAFEQAITVLIDNAIPLGLFQVAPPIPDYVDYNVISTYFTGIGYTVNISFPPPPYFGQEGSFVQPFYAPWNVTAPPPPYPSAGWAAWQRYVQRYHPVMTVTWGP